ncbi:hypothetical protein HY449_01950 [Candidatus Pacearchaeota archaeon]|nr:hypothetical protein [Candidatus Pacearchaeota archaeon]
MEIEKVSSASSLSCVILDYHEHFLHLGGFTGILNEAWGDFHPYFPANESQLVRVLEEFNPFFIGAFKGDEPAGILRTALRRFNEPPKSFDTIGKAAFICNQVSPFGPFTYDGEIVPHDENPNTIVCIDATVAKKFRGKNASPKVFSEMINELKYHVSKKPGDRIEQLSKIKYMITFTPTLKGIIRAHEEEFAFPTGAFLKDARPGYVLPNVSFMCYLVQSDFSSEPEYFANEEYFKKFVETRDKMRISA